MTQLNDVITLRKEFIGLSAVASYLYHSATSAEERASFGRQLDEINCAIEALSKIEEEQRND